MVDKKSLLAKRGILKRSMRARKARKHFGEITYGNHIVFAVDGEETFKPIYDAISQAESSIYIAGYDLDPSLNFVPGDGHNASNMGGGSLGNGITINRNSCLSRSKSSRFTKERRR